MATCTVRIADPFGANARIFPGNAYTRLELGYREKQIGWLTLDLPGFLSRDVFPIDGLVRVERSIDGAPPYLEGDRAWLIQKVTYLVGAQGTVTTRVVAVDGNDLLRRRIVDYNADTANTDKTDLADDMMKEIVRENFVSATDTTRNLSSTLFSVDADVGAAPSLTKAFTRREVLAVLQELAEAATLAGTYTTFEVVWTGAAFAFRTWTGQRGVDHSGADRVLLGPAYRNLTDVEDTDDATEEATRVIAGGQGEGADREIARADDATRQGASPYNLIEDFSNQNNTADATQLADEADSLLQLRRPRRVISGTFVDTPGATYGRHFGYGDLIVAEVNSQSVTCRVDAVHITVSGGREQVDIRLRSEA
jgi:hypothetical protein